MSVKMIKIEEEVAEEAESVAQVLGYKSVDAYITELLIKDIQDKKDIVMMIEAREDILREE